MTITPPGSPPSTARPVASQLYIYANAGTIELVDQGPEANLLSIVDTIDAEVSGFLSDGAPLIEYDTDEHVLRVLKPCQVWLAVFVEWNEPVDPTDFSIASSKPDPPFRLGSFVWVDAKRSVTTTSADFSVNAFLPPVLYATGDEFTLTAAAYGDDLSITYVDVTLTAAVVTPPEDSP